ncbi:uncharacterized protein BDR25DRAFT_362701 [Lindgomyces ingoldianus]|uniref:Uncharacterized protein n=1 Tax=Lindgomyces ingoldianus TaxID=673940 RepID=A0ACB6Q986_9PLEO|nr:uncharacterized protein BDR25DRAFT_362701 [Lindgomyces ingoldianus]KAF2463533.1 hypothetical protein BDR25DRAFT_362701 [Lindgomyces ingoldianus]
MTCSQFGDLPASCGDGPPPESMSVLIEAAAKHPETNLKLLGEALEPLKPQSLRQMSRTGDSQRGPPHQALPSLNGNSGKLTNPIARSSVAPEARREKKARAEGCLVLASPSFRLSFPNTTTTEQTEIDSLALRYEPSGEQPHALQLTTKLAQKPSPYAIVLQGPGLLLTQRLAVHVPSTPCKALSAILRQNPAFGELRSQDSLREASTIQAKCKRLSRYICSPSSSPASISQVSTTPDAALEVDLTMSTSTIGSSGFWFVIASPYFFPFASLKPSFTVPSVAVVLHRFMLIILAFLVLLSALCSCRPLPQLLFSYPSSCFSRANLLLSIHPAFFIPPFYLALFFLIYFLQQTFSKTFSSNPSFSFSVVILVLVYHVLIDDLDIHYPLPSSLDSSFWLFLLIKNNPLITFEPSSLLVDRRFLYPCFRCFGLVVPVFVVSFRLELALIVRSCYPRRFSLFPPFDAFPPRVISSYLSFEPSDVGKLTLSNYPWSLQAFSLSEQVIVSDIHSFLAGEFLQLVSVFSIFGSLSIWQNAVFSPVIDLELPVSGLPLVLSYRSSPLFPSLFPRSCHPAISSIFHPIFLSLFSTAFPAREPFSISFFFLDPFVFYESLRPSQPSWFLRVDQALANSFRIRFSMVGRLDFGLVRKAVYWSSESPEESFGLVHLIVSPFILSPVPPLRALPIIPRLFCFPFVLTSLLRLRLVFRFYAFPLLVNLHCPMPMALRILHYRVTRHHYRVFYFLDASCDLLHFIVQYP